MKRSIINNQRGITLISLIVTIIILSILAGLAITNIDTGADIKNYNYMCADIELLESKIMIYYNNNSTIPTTGSSFNAKTTLGSQASTRDSDTYYQIDISELKNVTLNYGGGSQSDGDIYIINEQSHEVYYLKGTEYEGNVYYTPFK